MKLGIPSSRFESRCKNICLSNRGGGMNIRDVCLSNVLCDDVPSLSSYRSLSILMFGLAPHPFPPSPFLHSRSSPGPRAPSPAPSTLLVMSHITFAISLLVPFRPHRIILPSSIYTLHCQFALACDVGATARVSSSIRFRFRKDESGNYGLVSGNIGMT